MTASLDAELTVTLIVATYNDAIHLDSGLRSALSGRRIPDEVIVVDDGSDGSQVPDAVAHYTKDFPRFVILRQENSGPSSARNLGLAHARGRLVAFLDADDSLCPDGISHRVDLLATAPAQCAGAYGSFTVGSSGTRPTFRTGHGELQHDLVGRPRGYPGGAPAYIFRKEALINVGGFDPRLRINEDFDVILRLSGAGHTFIGDNNPAFNRNYRADSLTRGTDPWRLHEYTMQFLDKASTEGLLSEAEVRRRAKGSLLGVAKKLSAGQVQQY